MFMYVKVSEKFTLWKDKLSNPVGFPKSCSIQKYSLIIGFPNALSTISGYTVGSLEGGTYLRGFVDGGKCLERCNAPTAFFAVESVAKRRQPSALWDRFER